MKSGEVWLANREKVVRGLKTCNRISCKGCPYLDDLKCIQRLHKQALELLKEQPRWIGVEDRLPERPDWYLVYAPEYNGGSSRRKEQHKGVMFAKWNGKSWGIEKGYYDRPNIVIAWREIPEPPEGLTQNGET